MTSKVSTYEEACISVELVGLRQSRSCIFYFNSREIGRIAGQDTDQEIEFPLSCLHSREGPFNRPWYKEDIHMDVYDSDGCKKSTYSSLLSLKNLGKSQVGEVIIIMFNIRFSLLLYLYKLSNYFCKYLFF
jgi:hypothetical protein